MSSNESEPSPVRAARTLTDDEIQTDSRLTRRLVLITGASVAAAAAAAIGFAFGDDVARCLERDKSVRRHAD